MVIPQFKSYKNILQQKDSTTGKTKDIQKYNKILFLQKTLPEETYVKNNTIKIHSTKLLQLNNTNNNTIENVEDQYLVDRYNLYITSDISNDDTEGKWICVNLKEDTISEEWMWEIHFKLDGTSGALEETKTIKYIHNEEGNIHKIVDTVNEFCNQFLLREYIPENSIESIINKELNLINKSHQGIQVYSITGKDEYYIQFKNQSREYNSIKSYIERIKTTEYKDLHDTLKENGIFGLICNEDQYKYAVKTHLQE